MDYAPHILMVRNMLTAYDSNGRIIPSDGSWVRLCPCRCDDDGSQELTTPTGEGYKSKYHVVAERHPLSDGDEVLILDAEGKERGKGTVTNLKRTNYLNYMHFYL